MKKIACQLKKVFTSITIMVIPHDNHKPINLKIPLAGILAVAFLTAVGGGYLFCLAVTGLDYKAQHNEMTEKLAFYSEQFNQWDSTVTALKTVEGEFKQLFSYKTQDEVLENVDTSYSGSLEIPDLIDR